MDKEVHLLSFVAAITNPWPDINVCLPKISLKLEYGWVITCNFLDVVTYLNPNLSAGLFILIW